MVWFFYIASMDYEITFYTVKAGQIIELDKKEIYFFRSESLLDINVGEEIYFEDENYNKYKGLLTEINKIISIHNYRGLNHSFKVDYIFTIE